MTLYSSLPASVQTSALSVAVRRRSDHDVDASASPDIVVSLHEYVGAAASCADVPLQLPASEYALTVSRDHFDLVRRTRVDGGGDLAALARLVVADVAADAATELARAFEYQLALLGDDDGLAARLGAERAAERAMEYLKRTSRHVDVNSLLRGVLDGRPSDAPATVSAIVGQRCELRWNVDDVFRRPGLRRERLLLAGDVDALAGYGTPWRFYASAHFTDATLYGYRGQLPVRDYHSEWLRGGRPPSYRLDVDEEAAYDVEVPWRLDDFHRIYRPYRRLVGSAVMASYAVLSYEDKTRLSLDQFVQQLQGDAFRRDEIEPVFRSLTSRVGREYDQTAGAKQDVTVPDEFTQRSNTIPQHTTSTHIQSVLSEAENLCQNEPVPTKSSTSKSNHPADERAVCSSEVKRRPAPPPVVKPKPSLDVRRRLSATGVASMTSLPVAQRQISMPDSTVQQATVRFPTLEELFGRELAAMRQASTNQTDNNRPASGVDN